jgi:hypothetical protein
MPALDAAGQAALPMPALAGGGLAWNLQNPRIADLRDKLGTRITRINETTREDITDQVAEGLKRGYSVVQIANGYPDENFKGIMGVFDQASEYRAEMISRTESAFAFNFFATRVRHAWRQAGHCHHTVRREAAARAATSRSPFRIGSSSATRSGRSRASERHSGRPARWAWRVRRRLAEARGADPRSRALAIALAQRSGAGWHPLMQLEHLAVHLERPAVHDAQVGAAQHRHVPATEMADNTLIAVSDQLAQRSKERRTVRPRPDRG